MKVATSSRETRDVFRWFTGMSGRALPIASPAKTISDLGMPQTSLREVGLLRRLRHPNIVRLEEVAVGTKLDSVFLVFEYCEHDLARLLDAMPSPFSASEVKCLMQQLLAAVAHLHANSIIHRQNKTPARLCASGPHPSIWVCAFP